MSNTVVPTPSVARKAVSSQTQAVGPARTRVLIGYFQPKDAAAYLSTLNSTVEAVDVPFVEKQFEDARAHVDQMGPRTDVSVADLAAHPHLVRLRAESTFAEHARGAESARLANIDVGGLTACQPRVDWDHVEHLADQVPAIGDEEGLLRFCLPLQAEAAPPRPQVSFNPATNTFGCIVDNPDIRICGPIQGEQAGAGRAFVGFALGAGLHQMSVVSFNGRHMLNNGYHRAVALARAGHTQIPVVFSEVQALELTPAVRNGMFNPRIVFGPTPPRIADFLSPGAVDILTRRSRFLFSIHAEQHPVPC